MFLQEVCSIAADDIKDEETVDGELVWNLEILSELVRCTGKELLPYISELESIISSTINLKCKKAYTRSAKVFLDKLAECRVPNLSKRN